MTLLRRNAEVVANPVVISLHFRTGFSNYVLQSRQSQKDIEYRSMTLQIEFERKRLHVVIHPLPVRRRGSEYTSTGSRSVQECRSPEKYDKNIDNVPLAIPTQPKCRTRLR